MTRYIVHIDIGDMSPTAAEAYVEKFKEDNLLFFNEDDKIVYMPNRRGFNSIDTFASREKQIYFSNDTETQRDILQTKLDEFFGPNTILVVYNSDLNGVVTKVTA